jgi:hypothetical protein
MLCCDGLGCRDEPPPPLLRSAGLAGDEELQQASLAVQLVSRLHGTTELAAGRAAALPAQLMKMWGVVCGDNAR